MKKAVLDTNVIVSALLSPQGIPARVLALLFNDKLQIIFSSKILIEYEDVLSRPVLKIDPKKKEKFIKVIGEVGVQVEPIASAIHFLDESDRIFCDTAKNSESTLITGNIKHYPAERFIMTPRQFFEEYETEKD